MKTKSNRILMLFIFTFSFYHSYSQEGKSKLYIIDTLALKGKVLHIIEKTNIKEFDLLSYMVNIFIPENDSIDLFDKKELKSYLKANNHTYYVWPSTFFFMVRAANHEKVENFKYFDRKILEGLIENRIKIKHKRLNITTYSINYSDFIIAKTDLCFLKNYYGEKMIKQQSGSVKIIVPNIFSKLSTLQNKE